MYQKRLRRVVMKALDKLYGSGLSLAGLDKEQAVDGIMLFYKELIQ